jgi:hypothetical protein
VPTPIVRIAEHTRENSHSAKVGAQHGAMGCLREVLHESGHVRRRLRSARRSYDIHTTQHGLSLRRDTPEKDRSKAKRVGNQHGNPHSPAPASCAACDPDSEIDLLCARRRAEADPVPQTHEQAM